MNMQADMDVLSKPLVSLARMLLSTRPLQSLHRKAFFASPSLCFMEMEERISSPVHVFSPYTLYLMFLNASSGVVFQVGVVATLNVVNYWLNYTIEGV
jgi:hypothetical protein